MPIITKVLTRRHRGGAVVEYIEHSPDPTSEDGTARSTWIRTVGDGVPVVLIHGQSIDHRMMLPLDPVIASAGRFRRLYIDLPGHGHSEPVAPMTTDGIVDVVADRLQSIVGTTPFAIIGASFGGAVAVGVADALGDQILGTALLAPALLPRDLRDLPEPGPDEANSDSAFLAGIPERDRAAFTAVTARRDRSQWILFDEYVRPGLTDHDARAVGELAAWQATSPARVPRTHGGRHLIITGRQDTVVGWRDQRALLDAYPRATYVVLDECGHNPHLERPRAVAALVADWLDSLRP
ncbi:alpha/beta hydrolase [Tsukamurella sp. NPDC003166]|uniref:alpha/beta fold hydrolase n=1 Tax=Tsukamurella sp. NPDC003166 TaxID=3154444 RepID=UPI0033A26698